MDSYNNNHQSENLICVKIMSWIFLSINLVIIILFASLDAGVIFIFPFSLHFSNELLILIGINTKNYCCYYTGIIICFLGNVCDSFFIFFFVLLSSSYGINSTEDIIIMVIIILISIQIWVEFFAYICYREKVKTYCSFNIGERVAPPVENLNYQPYAVPVPNIQVQNAENQIQQNVNNQNMIYAFPPPRKNINNQNMVYGIPPPVKNNEYQGIH